MKVLTPEEVMRIAGGLPNLAALDEVTYEANEEPPTSASAQFAALETALEARKG